MPDDAFTAAKLGRRQQRESGGAAGRYMLRLLHRHGIRRTLTHVEAAAMRQAAAVCSGGSSA